MMAQVQVHGNVYGGGNLADVKVNTEVNMSAGTVYGNVFGGGKGTGENSFMCDKAMVGANNEGAGADLSTDENKIKGTKVTISNGTVGTLEGTGENQTLVEGTGNVYGGGEVGRVEWNTQVYIGVGTGDGPFEPEIYGNVFGAGKGLETHGYSALVRGNSTVTVQGGAKIGYNVYGGGENSTVGRYWVKGINNIDNEGEPVPGAPTAPTDLPDGMPYQKQSGGKCSVTIKGNVEIGTLGVNDKGHVFGAGKGVDTRYVASGENQSKKMIGSNNLVAFTDETDGSGKIVKTAEQLYYEFLQTLALVTETHVTIDESAHVNGSVFGGSESGFVQTDANVKIKGNNCVIGTTTYGNVFGGGKGLEYFAEAGKVKGNTTVEISNGTVKGNVYGGGRLGDVGIIDKTEIDATTGKLTYNYKWKQSDGTTDNVANHNTNATATNTGICTVTISGGTIGVASTDKPKEHGNVFGASRGSEETWWCEKAMAFATNVTVKTSGSANTLIYGNVYGGGEVGRVGDDTKVTIGTSGGSDAPEIKGSVYGAGAGKETHGYSALVRGNAVVTVQSSAKVRGNVFGGGEIASVGRFTVVKGLPTKPETGGDCIVNIKDNAEIGTANDATTGHVYGACKGVTSHYNSTNSKSVYSMQTYENRPDPINTPGETWDYWTTYEEGYEGQKFIKRYYTTETEYLAFLKTLALTSNPHVTIGGTWTPNETTGTVTASGTPTVYGSVYGGGQRGVTLGAVDVNMVGGTVEGDVYGGGALADTNLGNWDVNGYVEATALNQGESITDLYTRTETEGNYTYTKVTDANATISSGTYYRQEATWAHNEGSAHYKTTVDLIGGLIKGDAYGGGLGQKDGFNGKTGDVAAVVWGDIDVNLGSSAANSSATSFQTSYYSGEHSTVVKSGRIFGCNNLLGSPQGDVKVTVYKTVTGIDGDGEDIMRTPQDPNNTGVPQKGTGVTQSYELAAVYGGGNLADYTAVGKKAYVRIETCDVSIQNVYGGGNAAEVPGTDVLVRGAYEIKEVFGGGNGKDPYTNGTTWIDNPGANVGNTTTPGNATTLLTGGYVHEAYGGSNKRGTIYGNVNIDMSEGSAENNTDGCCTLDVEKLVGAGKDADVNGDLILVMGCKPDVVTPVIYAGADNANVNGNVELTITSGKFGKVFGGNNQGGIIMGHIKLNIEETGNCDVPIEIDELYLGGNEATYSQYGYYKDGEVYKPRTAEMAAVSDDPSSSTYNPESSNYHPAITNAPDGTEIRRTAPYAAPELNVISCTYIGKVFGGGYGTGAALYGNPTVNINMIQGSHANTSLPTKMTALSLSSTDNPNKLGIIGDVYGGGNAADVIGNPTVNIGTASTVYLVSTDNTENVLGAYITGNVFGGGKGEADNFFCNKAMIGEDGAGIIDADGDGELDKDGGTTVNIFKGFVGGNVYGGGQIGRVEKNTAVTIGTGDGEASGTANPIIMGSVFGGGAGEEEHGYAALVRGNPTVIIQGNAKVRHSVYGGGEIASVARYNVPRTSEQVAAAIAEGYDAVLGMPYALKDPNSGTCTVTVRGYAEIGPETAMQMTKEGGPDDTGYVFGAGKGILPGGDYAFVQGTTRRMVLYDDKVHTSTTQGTGWQYVDPDHSDTNKNVWEYFANLDKYIEFIQTLALSSRTYVTITDNAFVKGSVYGGSENGIVQFNTDVKIQSGQIGQGAGESGAHPDAYWTSNSEDPTKFADCSSWEFKAPYHAYDPYAKYKKEANGEYYYDSSYTQDAEGGAVVATDGHTYYGNVFGGGSGSIPYFDATLGRSVYLHSAGQVKGNTNVTISGGHILTNVYGGCEATNVDGVANVTMTGGTVGVPRTDEQIIAHPLTGYLFGGGKGDQRVFFNKDTNVKDAVVKVEGGRVYGSVYGGGEDGHVLRNVTLTIGKQTETTGENNEVVTTTSGPKIGTKGTSYYDGHVFGGGRGFGGDALTAGNVGGAVDVNILDGEILGSVYGGGRLASVGYGLYLTTEEGYGEMRADDEYDGSYTNPSTEDAADFFTKGRGHVTMTISGGTIGNDDEYAYDADNKLAHTKGGNVFAGGMGRMYKLGSTTDPISSLDWWRLGNVKSTKLTITGGTIKSNVYGGGELGMVVGHHTVKDAQGNTVYTDANQTVAKVTSTEISISGSNTIIGTEVKDGSNVVQYTFGSVFGGGYGSLTEKLDHTGSTNPTYSTYKYTYPKYIAGRVKGSTDVTMTGGTVKASVYGGGEMAAVGESKVLADPGEGDPVVLGETLTGNNGVPIEANTYVTISGGTIGKEKVETKYFGGAKMGNVYGGGSGDNNTVRSGHVYGNTNVTISDGTIYHNVYGGGAYGSVGDFDYKTDEEQVTVNNETVTVKKVSGIKELKTSGTGVATVTITGGTIGYDGKENGMVFGSSRGDINEPDQRDDHTAWVYDTHVTIGTSGSNSDPHIRGTVYGSGENGHVFNDTEVTVNSGTIGIYNDTDHTYDITSNNKTYNGADYPYRGNVYGGGCGTDKYYSNHAEETHDGNGQLYNSLAGIVYGNTTVNITGGRVVHNVYGAGAMGSVGKVVTTDGVTSITSGGQTTINISGGQIGDDGVNDGNVYGAARGDSLNSQTNVALVKNTSVNISSSTAIVKNNVYGGGETGDVMGNTEVNVGVEKQTSGQTVTYVASGNPSIGGNVYGGGKGVANSFTCAKAMVGVEGDGVTITGTSPNETYTLEDGGTTVRFYNGTVGTLEGEEGSQTLKTGTGNVYGGGEIARVERNTSVEIGAATGNSAPVIQGSVFAAGAGLVTHGYSALVRGTSSVTVQGGAKVKKNVYGGGENASVGRYKVKISNGNPSDAPADLPAGMPYGLKAGGTSYVVIQGNAEIGTANDATTGHVYGAGQGVEPRDYDYVSADDYNGAEGTYKIDEHQPKRMIGDNTWEYFGSKEAYLQFIETLAISASTDVTIDGSAKVKGSVFGGSESGFVYRNTDVKIQGGTVYGDAFGGGLGLESFAEAGHVRWNTNLAISDGAVQGNVYGGGKLGDVGTINKEASGYNYKWIKTGSNGNVHVTDNYNTAENNNVTYAANETNKNTGICTVSITGGTIGLASTDKPKEHGNVFGAGRGLANTFWCEKAMAFATNVSVSGSTTVVNGNVYGGGEVGRVEDDSKVIIGTAVESDAPDIKGSVYGAGAGLETHGYSALVRGNSVVTVQGSSKVGGNVFGGGEIASLGKFKLDDNKLPKEPDGGGASTVTITDNAKIGSSGTDNDVYGAGQGVVPNWVYTEYTSATPYVDRIKNSKRMVTYTSSTAHPEGKQYKEWDYYDEDHTYVWEYYPTETAYQAYLKTLAIASHPIVTIAEGAIVYGDVYGGGQRGITLGDVAVNITGGTVKQDVYGGGSLADTNKGNWDDSQYVEVTDLPVDHTLTDLYTKTGDTYIAVASNATATSGTTYYSKGTWATGKYDGTATTYKTNVALTGGTIDGNVYGGGLGQIAREASAAVGTEGQEGYKPAVTKLDEVEAKVYGDVLVTLNKPTTSGANPTYGNCVVKKNIFGCNNQNGSPQSTVMVHVYSTKGWDGHEGTPSDKLNSEVASDHSYHLNGVYGGGNLSAFYPDLKATRDTVQAFVIIDGCGETSIKQVYGGGNAASIPATNITINATYEIEEVFGGGNGKDDVSYDGGTTYVTNPGANVGYERYPTDFDIPKSSKEIRTARFSYGSGKSSVTIYDGLIHRVFGGSNNKGNVRESAVTLLDDQAGCHFQVDEAYGGGKNAPMDAEAKLLMACIPGLKVAYGGAQEADVLGGVTLTITNGTYERVFGGNNISGTIQGPIVVNIEETGCRPVIIGELYGGGNQAGYSVYGYESDRTLKDSGEKLYDDPQVNVKSFTSIGTIYGGGYGETAVMVGDPTVNINVFKGKYAESNDNVIGENAKVVGSTVTTDSSAEGYATGFPIPSHAKGAIGAIGTVFGGGNAAEVIGNPTVNIGTDAGEEVFAVIDVVTGASVAGYYTRTGEGTTENPYSYSDPLGANAVAETGITYYQKTVKGADIRGDVFGAGNNAKVTGNTKVQIGKKVETSTTPDPEP